MTHPFVPLSVLPLQLHDATLSPARAGFFIGSSILLFLYTFGVLLIDCQHVQHAAYAFPPPFAQEADIRLFGMSLFGGPWAGAFGEGGRGRRVLSEVEVERVGTLTTFAGRSGGTERVQVEGMEGKEAETGSLAPSSTAVGLEETEKGEGSALQVQAGEAPSGESALSEAVPQVSDISCTHRLTPLCRCSEGAADDEVGCVLCELCSAWCASTRCAQAIRCCCCPACTCTRRTHSHQPHCCCCHGL